MEKSGGGTTVITCHTNADHDALGSMIAVARLVLDDDPLLLFPGTRSPPVEALYREARAASSLHFVSAIERPHAVERLIVVDTRHRARLVADAAALLERRALQLLVFDHHPDADDDIVPSARDCIDGATATTTTRQQTAVVEPLGACVSVVLRAVWRDLCASDDDALCERVRRRVGSCGVEARALLAGIYADTGCFCYASTTADDFWACAVLLRALTAAAAVKLDLSALVDSLGLHDGTHQQQQHHQQQQETAEDAAQAAMYAACVRASERWSVAGRRVVYGVIDVATAADDARQHASPQRQRAPNAAACVDRLLLATGADAAFVAVDERTRIALIARARSGAGVDVAGVCAALGGGGHAAAASASVRDMPLAELREELHALCAVSLAAADTGGGERAAPACVGDYATTPVVAVHERWPLRRAARLMLRLNLKKVPVLSALPDDAAGAAADAAEAAEAAADGVVGAGVARVDERRVVGILDRVTTDKALAIGEGLGAAPAAEFMDTEFATLPAAAPLARAVPIVFHTHQRLIPVLRDERLAGVLSRTDLMQLLMRRNAEPSAWQAETTRATTTTTDDATAATTTSLRRELSKLSGALQQLLRAVAKLGDARGVAVCVAGGFVRDALIGVANDDVDLVVEGDGGARAFADALNAAHGSGVRHFDQFATCTVTMRDFVPGLKVDVATARLEYYPQPVALPSVAISSLKMDLSRRDFTCNALAVRLAPSAAYGELVDFFGGVGDVARRTLRVLHSLSFVEDPTRLFRAARFEARHESWSVATRTARLARSAVERGYLARVSGARVWHELTKLFDEADAPRAIARAERPYRLLSSGVHAALAGVDESLLRAAADVLETWRRAAPPAAAAAPPPPPLDAHRFYWLATTALLANDAFDAACVRVGFDAHRRAALARHRAAAAAAKRLLRQYAADGAAARPSSLRALDATPLAVLLYALALVERRAAAAAPRAAARAAVLRYLTDYRTRRPLVNGNDLMQTLGVPRGRRIGALLSRLTDAVLDGDVAAHAKDAQLAYCRELLKEAEEEY